METGAFSIGTSQISNPGYSSFNDAMIGGFFYLGTAAVNGPLQSVGCKTIVVPFSGDSCTQITFPQATNPVTYKRVFIRHSIGGAFGSWDELYTTANVTKSSDGTLKAASPVARIIESRLASQRADIDEGTFEWCGAGVANDEAQGIAITREGVGVYRVTGALSLAAEGWRLLPPRDPDGSGDLGIVMAEESDGEIIVSLFRRKMVLIDGEIVIQAGEAIDVPANSWIDIRLTMPKSVTQSPSQHD